MHRSTTLSLAADLARPLAAHSAPRRWSSVALLFGLLAACGNSGTEREITTERTVAATGDEAPAGVSTAERFGFSSRGMPGSAPAASTGPHWTTPEGWSELPTSSMRAANFQVGDSEETECYLTILGGSGGGLLANVNRWCKQMSVPEMTAEAVEALPRHMFFGSPAVLVDLQGTYAGMGNQEKQESRRLLGLVQVGEGSARFLKLVGPEEVVSAQYDAFLELGASFHIDDGSHGSHGAPATAQSAAPAPSGNTGGGLSWEAPEGWVRGADRSMRAVTYQLGDAGEAECYVVVLGGAAGGVDANLNRWRQQMGQPALSSDELESLGRIPMLGGTGVVIEVAGHYTGMGDTLVENAYLFGAVRLLDDRAVFVKLIGPRTVVEPQRQAFLDFCQSLEIAS